MLLRSGRNLNPNDLQEEFNKKMRYDILISKFREYLQDFHHPERLDFLTRILIFRQVFSLVYENFEYINSKDFKNSERVMAIVRERIVHWNAEVDNHFAIYCMENKDVSANVVLAEITNTRNVIDLVANLL
jgi:hypothetical protein